MVHRTQSSVQTIGNEIISDSNWQHTLQASITDPQQLLSYLQLDATLLEGSMAASHDFPLRVPRPYLQRIRPGDPNDPLLLQILPQASERQVTPGYNNDPLEEADSNPVPGLIHKYQGRLLIITSGGCAINCRYCFRRHFPYADNSLGKEQWQEILRYLRQHSDVDEVIFSGGDPLATPDSRLQGMIEDLATIPHLRRLRLHSRLPVVIPARITPAFIAMLANSPLQTILVSHINHPREIDTEVATALQRLQHGGTTLLNQSVLLKGVNDDLTTLQDLSHRLFACGVMPYYLHLLDPVAGAAHFDIPEQRARHLAGQLSDSLPGYLVPRLVREVAGASAKVPLMPILAASGKADRHTELTG